MATERLLRPSTRDVRVLTGKVAATCPTCGTVEMRPGDMVIVPCIATIENAYRFYCPRCTSLIVRVATPRIVLSLLRSGVRIAP